MIAWYFVGRYRFGRCASMISRRRSPGFSPLRSKSWIRRRDASVGSIPSTALIFSNEAGRMTNPPFTEPLPSVRFLDAMTGFYHTPPQ